MAIIGLDLDGTCGDYNRMLWNIGKELGTVTGDTYTPATTYDMVEDGWFASTPDFLATHKVLCERGGLAKLAPLEAGLNEAVKAMKAAGHTVKVVTARIMDNHSDDLNTQVAKDTHHWLSRHIPSIDPADVIVTDHRSKGKFDIDIYIDDSPGQIRSLTGIGRKVIIRDQDYNQGIQGARVTSIAQAASLLV